MTDKQQPEALRLAAILEGDYCPDWFYEQGVDEVAAELRRLHAENATLRSGYDAARLEIESLKSQLAAEREVCANVCDAEAERALFNWRNDLPSNQKFWNGAEQFASACSAAIRARSTE